MSIRQILAALAAAGAILTVRAVGAADYHPISPDAGGKVITLTGHDLTIEDVVAVARHGAQVRYSPEAIQRAADGDALRAEAGAENIRPDIPYGAVAYHFMRQTPAANFYAGGPAMPATESMAIPRSAH